MSRRWLLPAYVEDILPAQAQALEKYRRLLLDELFAWSYELIVPPLVEFEDALLVGSGQELELRTCKLVDQLSGRTLGLRADMTPQVARVDAHLLNRQGVVRLCYFGPVLHSTPSSLTSTREPIQLGAELYGHETIEADIEILQLLSRILSLCPLEDVHIDLGHAGLFHALVEAGRWEPQQANEIHTALQKKDAARLQEIGVAAPYAQALNMMMNSQGGEEVLARVQKHMPNLPNLQHYFDEMSILSKALPHLKIGFDLAELGGYHYHTGAVFSAYAKGHTHVLAQGGRYDHVGEAFGRSRPATGFSMDVREILRLESHSPLGILVSGKINAEARKAIDKLRLSGERVAFELPNHEGTWKEAGFDRRLVERDGQWVVLPLEE